jgi:DNA-binding transcriptional LysR family regulator
VLPQGSVYRQLAVDALNAAGLPWTLRSICDSFAGLQAAVLAGIAVSAFPRCTITPNIRMLNKSDGLPELPTIEMVLHRKEQGVSDAAEQLARYLARELGNLPAADK